MDRILVNEIMEFLPDTSEEVRKGISLDKPGRMQEALDILEEWVQKQQHFTRKDICKEYLERMLVSSKGSIERTKQRLDKLCTLRTLMPEFYSVTDIRKEFAPFLSNKLAHAILPKLTKDHYRVIMCRFLEEFDGSDFITYIKYVIMLCEYLMYNDYSRGILLIVDYREINAMNLINKLSPTLYSQVIKILTEGYGMKLKGSYAISESKTMEVVTSYFKKFLSPKLASRIHVVKKEQELHQFVPKEVLPAEYGGEERSLKTLCEEWLDLFSSPKHVHLYEETRKFTINDKYRQTDEFNETNLGMPGTFRNLTLD